MLTSVREMGKSLEAKEKKAGQRAGLFSVLGPYKGIVLHIDHHGPGRKRRKPAHPEDHCPGH